jgi:hypothetical protein
MILFYILLVLIVVIFLLCILGMSISDTQTFRAIDERIANKIRRI